MGARPLVVSNIKSSCRSSNVAKNFDFEYNRVSSTFQLHLYNEEKLCVAAGSFSAVLQIWGL